MRPVRATYRLQLHRDFDLDRAAALCDYLQALGVSHLYASPYLKAVPGSMHGYDVVDPSRINDELGGEPAHARLVAALEAHGLGQILDIVPNHMAIGTADNRYWWDVLENGPASRYASFFDVDWDAPPDTRILLPILGEHYGDALLAGLVLLERRGGRLLIRYHDHELPAAPRSVALPLRAAAQQVGSRALAFFADGLEALPLPQTTDPESVARRHRDKETLFELLQRALEEDPTLASALDRQLASLNADPAALDSWLQRQNFRLAFWQNANTELGYRRFFDVNSLAGLRVELKHVFSETHHLILAWLRDGTLDGVRIDHVDGLRDPARYLARLRRVAPDALIVVEKILGPNETLPAQWPVDGTTGYEVSAWLDQLFVAPGSRAVLDALATRFAGTAQDWPSMAREARLQILEQVLSSERERLVDLAYRALCQRMELRDYTRREISLALTELLASYPVYRTYVTSAADGGSSAQDEHVIAQALAAARTHRPEVAERVWTALGDALGARTEDPASLELALRLQQVSGAVAAKAIEDTLYYRFTRLLALNEVGGAPEPFGMSGAAFHDAMRARAGQAGRPGLIAGSTHDTKRGEDLRARLCVVSELPEEWSQAVTRWMGRAQRHVSAAGAPDASTLYFFFQTWVGAFPLTTARALAYMEKATREAKEHTSWTAPNADYEAALRHFVERALMDVELAADIERFATRVALPGFYASLARTLLKLTVPGIPDIYQGSELWDLRLVDPDNRSPVDFEARRALLRRAKTLSTDAALSELPAATPKLWLIQRVLSLRRTRPELFDAPYRGLATTGTHAGRVLSFARGEDLISVVPCSGTLAADGGQGFGDTCVSLPAGRYRDALTDQIFEPSVDETACSQLFARWPGALLVAERP